MTCETYISNCQNIETLLHRGSFWSEACGISDMKSASGDSTRGKKVKMDKKGVSYG